MKLILFATLALALAGCSAQSYPSWTRTTAENDCYDRHVETQCYVAHQQETAAWANAVGSWQQATAPGTVFNPVNVRIEPY